MTATDAQVDTLAELLSWTSGEFTRYSPDAHPDHNRWSWRGDGHGGKVRDEFRAQARLLLGEGVAVGVMGRVGLFEGARSDEQGEEAPGAVRGCGSASGAREGVTEADRDRMRCHRDGDTCAWAGCPNQFDDQPSTGCFLVGARKDDA